MEPQDVTIKTGDAVQPGLWVDTLVLSQIFPTEDGGQRFTSDIMAIVQLDNGGVVARKLRDIRCTRTRR